jgi:protein MpaA
MNALVNAPTVSPAVPRLARRSLAELLAPLDRLADNSASLIARHDAHFEVGGEAYTLPRYLFIGPHAGGDPLRIGLFAAIHGDEPAGAYALTELLKFLEANSALAAGYCLFAYPVTNPTGFEDNTQHSRRGRDLNREFWNNSKEPEVVLLQSELVAHAFDGIISLHADDTSDGIYGFVSGATLTRHLIEPALRVAEQWLPRNHQQVIDGFAARKGVIRRGYQGVLSAPPKVRPRPFEIVLETPATAPQFLQEKALVAATLSILAEYRKFIAYAPNL